jgi:8-oxo-dGTP diphosphatase
LKKTEYENILMLHVVVGILTNNKDEVLITQRRSGTHLAGMWEFPGGKLEPGEVPVDALSRELYEELGVEVTQAEPFIRVHYHYPERDVLLDVWKVTQYVGEAYGREQQPLQWVLPEQLNGYDLPPADIPILKALLLPNYYVILDADNLSSEQLHWQLKSNAANQYSLFLLRAKSLDSKFYSHLAGDLIQLSAQLNVKLLLNSSVEQVTDLSAAGLHLSVQTASVLNKRPLTPDFLLGVSCHSAAELQIAQSLDADFALLSPVQHTQSHLFATPLGWDLFATLIDSVNLPVYGLGGLSSADLVKAKNNGAQGVAGISMFAAGHSE